MHSLDERRLAGRGWAVSGARPAKKLATAVPAAPRGGVRGDPDALASRNHPLEGRHTYPAGESGRPWRWPRGSAEQAAADVTAGGGDLTQLVEELHGGQVGWGQLERRSEAAGPKRDDIGEQALD